MPLNLSEITEQLRNEMQSTKIEFSKKVSQLSAEGRKNTKTGKCLYCSKETDSYCNSHSIPASFLRNIAEDGKLYTHAGLIELPLLKKDTGVNNAGTFFIICRDCDSKIFNEYENKDNYENPPSQKMLAQIALKNHLKTISQRAFEISFNEAIETDSGIDLSNINQIKDSDLKENIKGFKKAKKVNTKCIQDEYYLFLNEKLDYVVPIAFQHQLALAVDLEGGIINNLYNHDKNYEIQLVHLAIFPLEKSSIVLMFIDKNCGRYKAFIKQLKRLSSIERLRIINHIVFLYSEDFYLSKKIREEVMTDATLKSVSGNTGISFMMPGENVTEKLKEAYSICDTENTPNLLAPEHRIGD